MPQYKAGDNVYVKCVVLGNYPPNVEGAIYVQYGSNKQFFVDLCDISNHEPRAITKGDYVSLIDKGYKFEASKYKVEAVSPDGKYVWLNTSDGGYATFKTDQLFRVDAPPSQD